MTKEQLAYCQSWRDANREKVNGRQRARRAANPERSRLEYLRSKPRIAERLYGIPQMEFKSMLDAQNNACAVCKKVKTLCVDHDHRTGKVRGFLCRNCNLAAGHFKDDPDLIRKNAARLERRAGAP